jgi:hypothetical protein
MERYRVLLARLRTIDRSQSMVGLYLPATDAQIWETEERIGFALPPALRMLYQEVGNGGDIFGLGRIHTQWRSWWISARRATRGRLAMRIQY